MNRRTFAILSASVLACTAQAQIVPKEKRDQAVARIPRLEAPAADNFAERVAGAPNPFYPDLVIVDDQPAQRGPTDLEQTLRRDLRISGIFNLGEGRQFVFLNGRRMSPGEEARIQVGGRELRIRLVEIGSRTVTLESSGQTLTLPTR